MKKSEIKIGNWYAVKVPGRYRGDSSRILSGRLIRPEQNKWVVVLDPNPAEGIHEDPVDQRTHTLASSALIAPWLDYCIDSAHTEAIRLDNNRTMQLDYEAEWDRRARHRKPLCEALQGITIPGKSVSSANFDLPDVDLGEWAAEKFIDQRTSGVSIGFDVIEAVAKEILDLRRALLDTESGWTEHIEGPTDTGIPEVMVAEANTPLAAVQRLAAAIEPDRPAGT
jgi:hypothetical protein